MILIADYDSDVRISSGICPVKTYPMMEVNMIIQEMTMTEFEEGLKKTIEHWKKKIKRGEDNLPSEEILGEIERLIKKLR